MVQSTNWVTREWAVRLLAAKGGAGRHADALLSQLEREEDSDVTKALTEALGALDAVDEARLIGMVQSTNWVTREWAVRRLADDGRVPNHFATLIHALSTGTRRYCRSNSSSKSHGRPSSGHEAYLLRPWKRYFSACSMNCRETSWTSSQNACSTNSAKILGRSWSY